MLRNRKGRSEPLIGLSFDTVGKVDVIGLSRYCKKRTSPIPNEPQITGSSSRRRSKTGSSWTIPNADIRIGWNCLLGLQRRERFEP